VLGICLGAQLLAAAAGARVYPNTRRAADGAVVLAREVGWGAVDFAAGAPEPALAGLRAKEMVLHWHGDTFDLPRGAMPLASTAACRNQAFRLGWKAFALQFHCELSAEDVAVWVREDADYVREANGEEGAARIPRRHGALLRRSGAGLGPPAAQHHRTDARRLGRRRRSRGRAGRAPSPLPSPREATPCRLHLRARRE